MRYTTKKHDESDSWRVWRCLPKATHLLQEKILYSEKLPLLNLKIKRTKTEVVDHSKCLWQVVRITTNVNGLIDGWMDG